MKQTFSIYEKINLLLKILLPILITQVGMYAMSFFDTMMAGKAGPTDLAGVAIGSSLWIPISSGIAGILLALTPIVAQQIGAKEKNKVPFSVTQAIYLSLFLAVIVLFSGFMTIDHVLTIMNLDQDVSYIAKHFLIGLGYGVIPYFLYCSIRSFIDSLGQTRVSMIITLISLPINILLNYILIFGKLGMPRLGGIGTGYATATTYWIILAIAIFIVIQHKPFTQFQLFRTSFRVSFSEWRTLLKIGIPIGFAIFFETSIFAAVTLLMSAYDTFTIASHQAANNFATMLYMIPLSISMGLTIIVGHEIGAKRYKDARIYSYLGLGMAISLAVITSVLLFIFRGKVAGLYTDNNEVLQLTKQFLLYAILFQFFDAIAAPIQGALRGYKDVNVTFILALISYWLIGLPVGYLMANYTTFGSFGYWVGLIVGLGVGAILLLVRLLKKHSDASLAFSSTIKTHGS